MYSLNLLAPRPSVVNSSWLADSGCREDPRIDIAKLPVMNCNIEVHIIWTESEISDS